MVCLRYCLKCFPPVFLYREPTVIVAHAVEGMGALRAFYDRRFELSLPVELYVSQIETPYSPFLLLSFFSSS